jgi:hypothetical protein
MWARNGLGGREEAQKQGDQQVAGQEQEGPVPQTPQHLQPSPQLLPIQHLIAPPAQPDRPKAPIQPPLQTVIELRLELPPEHVQQQDDQGQRQPREPGLQAVAAAVLLEGTAHLVAIQLGQLFSGESKGPGRPLIHGELGLKAAVTTLHPHHEVRRVLLHHKLLRINPLVLRQLLQDPASPLGHELGGLGAGRHTHLQHLPPIEGDPRRGRQPFGSVLNRCGHGSPETHRQDQGRHHQPQRQPALHPSPGCSDDSTHHCAGAHLKPAWRRPPQASAQTLLRSRRQARPLGQSAPPPPIEGG